MAPKNLSREQKDIRKGRCLNVLQSLENDPQFLEHVTGDESWILEYDPETERQSMELHTSTSPWPKKARMSKSKIKYTLICFFDSHRIVHSQFLPQGQTVN